MRDPKKKAELLERLAEVGGVAKGAAAKVAQELGVPEAEVYGAGSFYHLLSDPDTKVRVCTGLSCALKGAHEILAEAKAAGLPAAACSCLAACDRPPAVLRDRSVLVEVTGADIDATGGDWEKLSAEEAATDWRGIIGPTDVAAESLAMNLGGALDYSGGAFARAEELGAEKVIEEVDAAGLQGRGGAGFPAAIKWRGVRAQEASPHYVVLNADEGEPGTFKDRELMVRRPDLVLEGLAIAAKALGAEDVYLYLRGEFQGPWVALEKAIEAFGDKLGGVKFHLHSGHGAYICGEETALLEALEGKRGMPRLKPPFPTENGLWGKPTLIQNVETIACVPAIVMRGGAWFKALGRTEPGTKLYSVSGAVKHPGTYELPLGVSLDELAEAAGGYDGTLYAFSPGGASSGFLPASERERPLDFASLGNVGSMLGSAGVVVLNTEHGLLEAIGDQLSFFEVESCGQCAPCRIGTRFLREALDRFREAPKIERDKGTLTQVAEVAWEMNEGSICGLGQAAPLPLTTALRHFPEAFDDK